MTRDILAALFGLGALFLATDHAFAQQNRNCAPRAAVVEKLAGEFGESRQSIGLAANNQVVEVFASRDTGSWTIVVSTTAGISCIVASGQAYEATVEHLTPSGAPA